MKGFRFVPLLVLRMGFTGPRGTLVVLETAKAISPRRTWGGFRNELVHWHREVHGYLLPNEKAMVANADRMFKSRFLLGCEWNQTLAAQRQKTGCSQGLGTRLLHRIRSSGGGFGSNFFDGGKNAPEPRTTKYLAPTALLSVRYERLF